MEASSAGRVSTVRPIHSRRPARMSVAVTAVMVRASLTSV
jgi:hypothetical protein